MKDETSDVVVTFRNTYSETPVASATPSAPLYIPGVGFAKSFEENVYQNGVDNAGIKMNRPPPPPPRVQSDPIKTQFARVSQDKDPEAKSTKPWRKIAGRCKTFGSLLLILVLTIYVIISSALLFAKTFKLEDQLEEQKKVIEGKERKIETLELNINTDKKDVKDRMDGLETILTNQGSKLEDLSSNLTNEIRRVDILRSCHAATTSMEVRKIYPPGLNRGLNVHCDGVSDDGGWMIFQHRESGDLYFNQIWSAYVEGFGSLTSDYWLGLQTLHELTSQNEYELRVDLVDFCGHSGYAQYSTFRVDGPSENYRLHVSGFSQGNIPDSLALSNGQEFAIPTSSSPFCASGGYGGWWYSSHCGDSNLNGEYFSRYYYSSSCYASTYANPMFWHYFRSSRSDRAAILSSSMKMRLKLV